MGGLPDPIRLRENEPGAPGARGQAWHAGPGGREKLLGAGGCRSFGELFHLRFYNPAVPPTESCSRGGRAPPTTPPAASSGAAQAAWSSSCSFGIFFLPPLLVVFLIHLFFFRIGKKKKKKASASRRLQWSVLGLQRQSSPTFPLPPQLRARLETSALLEPKFACRSTPL